MLITSNEQSLSASSAEEQMVVKLFFLRKDIVYFDVEIAIQIHQKIFLLLRIVS